MRWPWVSRRAFDLAIDERDRLREQNLYLTDSVVRITRREAGLPEIPRELKPPPDPMPRALREHIESWASKATRDQEKRRAYALLKEGKPWGEIMEILMPDVEGAVDGHTE